MVKIFITGCAKTGTTLVRRLFNAFDLKVYNHDELDVDPFLASVFDVGKRSGRSVLSQSLGAEECLRQLRALQDCIIINVVRNMEDVLKSDNGFVPPKRYEDTMEQAETYKNHIGYTIKYEDLMVDLDKIQREIADKFKLTICHKWSEYPNFVNINEEVSHTHSGIYKLRPIGAPKNWTEDK